MEFRESSSHLHTHKYTYVYHEQKKTQQRTGNNSNGAAHKLPCEQSVPIVQLSELSLVLFFWLLCYFIFILQKLLSRHLKVFNRIFKVSMFGSFFLRLHYPLGTPPCIVLPTVLTYNGKNKTEKIFCPGFNYNFATYAQTLTHWHKYMLTHLKAYHMHEFTYVCAAGPTSGAVSSIKMSSAVKCSITV